LAKTSIRQVVFSGRRVVGPIALFIFPNTRAHAAVTFPSCLTLAGLEEKEFGGGRDRGRSSTGRGGLKPPLPPLGPWSPS
jgi:hypothetical protein